jgi:hypothetical protein
LSDLNQFAGKWKALMHFYGKPEMHVRQFLTWLEFTQGEQGLYQRVVGSSTLVVDPLRLSGSEQGLMNIVLDVYLPDCGLVSWLFGYGDDTKAEAAVMAYKLAGDRTLWVSQFYERKVVEEAIEKKQPLPKSDDFNLTLEWIVIVGGRKYRYLVSKTVSIKFGGATVTAGTPATAPAVTPATATAATATETPATVTAGTPATGTSRTRATAAPATPATTAPVTPATVTPLTDPLLKVESSTE